MKIFSVLDEKNVIMCQFYSDFLPITNLAKARKIKKNPSSFIIP